MFLKSEVFVIGEFARASFTVVPSKEFEKNDDIELPPLQNHFLKIASMASNLVVKGPIVVNIRLLSSSSVMAVSGTVRKKSCVSSISRKY